MNGFTSGRLEKGKHYWCPGNSGEQLSAGLDGKLPRGQAPWQPDNAHGHPVGPARTLTAWGHVPGPTVGTSCVNIHSRCLHSPVSQTHKHDLTQEQSLHFGWHLLHKDPCAFTQVLLAFPSMLITVHSC